MILLFEHPAAGPVRKWKNGFCFSKARFLRRLFARALLDARAPNQSFGRLLTGQGHPRAALDANDLWIRLGEKGTA
jgi:hypothetical protein